MKVTKEGKVKMEKGERRFGNFFVKDEGENEHIRVSDLNSCFSVRISNRMPLGIWMDNILKMGEKGEETIQTWVGAMWTVLSMAPDQDYVKDLIGAADANLKRHPDWYGGSLEEATEEDDAKALEEVKNLSEFEEDIRKLDTDGVPVQPEA